MQWDLIPLGYALAAYRAEHSTYPEHLVDLTPNDAHRIPNDLFTGGPLHYRVQGDGYLAYSVGPNGKDDGGKGWGDPDNTEGWDDVRVQVRSTR